MAFPPNWQSPITTQAGHVQLDVNAHSLLPSRQDLSQVRLDMQKAMMDAGIERNTLIEVTPEGVIWDGHHAVRAAAENGRPVTVRIVSVPLNPTASSIMDLPVS